MRVNVTGVAGAYRMGVRVFPVIPLYMASLPFRSNILNSRLPGSERRMVSKPVLARIERICGDDRRKA